MAASNNTVREWSKSRRLWRRIWIISPGEQSTDGPWALREIAQQRAGRSPIQHSLTGGFYTFEKKCISSYPHRYSLATYFCNLNCCFCFLRPGWMDEHLISQVGWRSTGTTETRGTSLQWARTLKAAIKNQAPVPSDGQNYKNPHSIPKALN